jgi:hypothetical protein
VQLVNAAFLNTSISSLGDFSAALSDAPASLSDIFAEFTFTSDLSFDWAGYSFYGYFGSGYEVSFTVTITRLS